MQSNLFIGRWMPFHEGHKYIIDSYVNNGKKVCIAIRDTEPSVENPFSARLRARLIEDVYIGNPLVEVIIIPDIESVVVGRGVGYSIAEAPESIEKMSGTEIRKNKEIKFNSGKGFCVWFTGLPASGKTTLSQLLSSKLRKPTDEGALVVERLDGDTFRETFTKGLGFSAEDRYANLQTAVKVAKDLIDYGVVVLCSFITPYQMIRDQIRKRFDEKYFEVYLKCPTEVCERRDPKGMWKRAREGELKEFTGVSAPFEESTNPNLVLHTDTDSPEICVQKIIMFLEEKGVLIDVS